jgi:hypothetical protein
LASLIFGKRALKKGGYFISDLAIAKDNTLHRQMLTLITFERIKRRIGLIRPS